MTSWCHIPSLTHSHHHQGEIEDFGSQMSHVRLYILGEAIDDRMADTIETIHHNILNHFMTPDNPRTISSAKGTTVLQSFDLSHGFVHNGAGLQRGKHKGGNSSSAVGKTK